MSEADATISASGSDLAAYWPMILDAVDQRVQGSSQQNKVRIWLRNEQVAPYAIDEGKLVIACPTALFQMQIRNNFCDLLVEAVREIVELPIDDVVCRVSRDAFRRHQERVEQNDTEVAVEESPALRQQRGRRAAHGFKMLADFVVGSCNRLAFDAIQRIVEEPSHPVNPLFIHGSSGLGKTHLEQGLAVAYRARYPACNVSYLTCEQFRNAYLAACEGGTNGLQAFRVKLRHADLLLIDDIHFLSRGQMERTKDELFSTLDELQERGKKIVITSDAHPNDIKYLEARFVQRFTGGLVVALDRPDIATRRDVVAAKAQSQRIELPDEVTEFVAAHITDNMREIEGAVNKIIAYATSFRRQIDLSLARQALADLIARDASEPRHKVVLRSVADYFDLTVEDLTGKGRSGHRSTARHIAMYVLKASGADTYAAVANTFGVKSHSSVTYACSQAVKYRGQDGEIDRFITELLMRVRRR